MNHIDTGLETRIFNNNSFKSQFSFDLPSFSEVTGLGELTRFGELTGFGELTTFGEITRFGVLTRFGEITSFSELTAYYLDNFTQIYPKTGSHSDPFDSNLTIITILPCV